MTHSSENTQNVTNKKESTRRLIIYLAITFTITYLFEFLLIWPAAQKTDLTSQAIAQLLTAVAMFLPALGVLLTRLITKEGFQNSYIAPKTGAKSVPYFLFGAFGFSLLAVVGTLIYFLVFPDKYDPHMGYLAAALTAQGVDASEAMLKMTAISQIISGLLFAPILNFIPCFGEEWGWRGYLLPKMQEHFSLLPTLLISGFIWGIWHMPITMLGHNYGLDYPGYPFVGIFAMCIFCIVTGTILAYLTIRTGSCLPATLGHAGINGFAAVGLMYTDGTEVYSFIGPAPTGIVGGCGFIICAIIVTVLMLRKEKSDRNSAL